MEGAIVVGLGNGNGVHTGPAATAVGKLEVIYGQNLPGNPLMFVPLFGTSVVTGVDRPGWKDAAESLVIANDVVVVKSVVARSPRKAGKGISGCTVTSRL